MTKVYIPLYYHIEPKLESYTFGAFTSKKVAIDVLIDNLVKMERISLKHFLDFYDVYDQHCVSFFNDKDKKPFSKEELSQLLKEWINGNLEMFNTELAEMLSDDFFNIVWNCKITEVELERR
jgi:hypothetical protein